MRKKNHKKFMKFNILMIFVIVGIILLTVSITTFISSKALYGQAAKANTVFLQNFSGKVETFISDIGNSTISSINRSLYISGYDTVQWDDRLKEALGTSISHFIEQKPYIDSIYLYSTTNQKVFYYSARATDFMDLNDFFDSPKYEEVQGMDTYTYTTESRMIKPNYHGPDIFLNKDIATVISIFKKIPLRSTVYDTVVINIGQNYFDTMFENSNVPDFARLYVCDDKGKSTVTYGVTDNNPQLTPADFNDIYEQSFDENGILKSSFSYHFKSQNFFISVYKSGNERLYYLLVPKSSLTSSYKGVNGVIIVITILMMIIGAILILYISDTVSNPISTLLSKLSPRVNTESADDLQKKKGSIIKYTEFKQIEEQIDSMIQKNVTQEKILDDYFKHDKERILVALLEGVSSLKDISHKATLFSNEFKNFMTIFYEVAVQNDVDEHKKASYIEQVGNTLNNLGYLEQAHISQNRHVFILCFSHTVTDDQLEFTLQKTLALKPDFSVITIAIGCECKVIDTIHQSYKEAVLLLDKAALSIEDRILRYSHGMPKTGISFDEIIRYQDKIIKALNAKNQEETIVYIREYYQLFNRYGMSFRQIEKYLLFLLCNIANELSALGFKSKDAIFSESMFDSLDSMTKGEEICDWIITVVQNLLADNAPKQQTNKNNTQLIEKVKAYINDRYKENISLYTIAEYVYFTPQYLGKLFKEETGMSFTNYLIQIRMDTARTLLLETQLSISDVGKKVGYNNIQSFERFFKKQFSCSPGEYRKNHIALDIDQHADEGG